MLQKPDIYTERLLRVADRIERSTTFNMGNWHECICGNIMREMGQEMGAGSTYAAAEFIGVDFTNGNKLWSGPHCTAKQAAKMLRHLAVTGEINWDVIKPKSLLQAIEALVV
jgi:hypothetical protein